MPTRLESSYTLQGAAVRGGWQCARWTSVAECRNPYRCAQCNAYARTSSNALAFGFVRRHLICSGSSRPSSHDRLQFLTGQATTTPCTNGHCRHRKKEGCSRYGLHAAYATLATPRRPQLLPASTDSRQNLAPWSCLPHSLIAPPGMRCLLVGSPPPVTFFHQCFGQGCCLPTPVQGPVQLGIILKTICFGTCMQSKIARGLCELG